MQGPEQSDKISHIDMGDDRIDISIDSSWMSDLPHRSPISSISHIEIPIIPCPSGPELWGHGASEANPAEAMQWLRKAAEQGNADAQNLLGEMYASGDGVAGLDHVEAVKWYRLSAHRGNPMAQLHLAKAYATGRGVEQNQARAVGWQGPGPPDNARPFSSVYRHIQDPRFLIDSPSPSCCELLHAGPVVRLRESAERGNGQAMHDLCLALRIGRGFC